MKNEEQKLYQIGEYVRICRKKGGYSQEELAEGVDVSKMTISRIENGENAMSILLFFQIVSFLDFRKKKLSDCSETVIKRAGKHRDGDKNIRFYIYVTKNNIYVI